MFKKNCSFALLTIAETNTRITKTFSAIDESFVRNRTANFHLSISLGKNGMKYAVLDIKNNRYIALESHSFEKSFSSSAIAEATNVLLNKNEVTHNLFKSIQISIENEIATIIPNAVYEKGSEKSYLRHCSNVAQSDDFFTYDLKNIDAKIIFGTDKKLVSELKKYFPNGKINHICSAFTEGILINNKNINGEKIFVNVQPGFFQLIVMKGKDLILCNTFYYESSEDFLYFILFTCEQLKLNPETVQVFLLGEVEKNSAIYTILYKYIRNVNFGLRNDNFGYCHRLEEIPKHFYYTLFNQYLCA